MPPHRILGQLHQRLPAVAVQAVADLQADAAERSPHMNRGDMLIRISGIKADKITDLLAFHIDNIERLAFADECASALVGRDRDFFD